MTSRNRSPSKQFRKINMTVLDYKRRRNLTRMTRYLFYTVFITILTVISFKLMRTYDHKVEAPHFDFFHETFKSSNRKIDWHDYEKIQKELLMGGLGEQGKPGNYSHLPKDLVDKMYKLNGYNGALSDIISVDRSLPDIRHPDCKKKLYRSVLPTVSIIIPFHNEHPSTLIRTARSVINRAPEHLIKEIIYVDDFSSRDALKKEFVNYIADNLPKAKIVKLEERRGLINARLAGAKVAKGDVLIFLDAHCEATVNWLPPLLDPITEDYKTCMCPFIDVIDYDTYEYRAQDEGGRGMFNWNLIYKRLPRLKEDKKKPTEPFASPVMAGGLFAIAARFFWELGGYDEGLDIWGGEQYELSFKIWQCGGRMLDAPCSRVGHIYRKFDPFPNPREGKDFLCLNFKRVAEVWMDEYKQYYYMRHPDCEKQDEGDISSQLALRERLQCKPFKWFMEEIAFDLIVRFPLIDPPDVAKGFIRNIAHPNLCIESQENTINMNKCIPGYWAQNFRLSYKGDIRCGESDDCWDVSDHQSERSPVNMDDCHGAGGNQLWKYDEDNKNTVIEGRCLDMDPTTNQIFVSQCNPDSNTQQWEFEHIDTKENEKLEKYAMSIKSGLITFQDDD